jgi:hypothetical protein
LEIEIVNDKVKVVFIVLANYLLDGVQTLIRLDKGSGVDRWIRPFAIRKGQIESLRQRAAEEGNRKVEDGDIKVLLGSMAEGKPN